MTHSQILKLQTVHNYIFPYSLVRSDLPFVVVIVVVVVVVVVMVMVIVLFVCLFCWVVNTYMS